MSDPGTIIKELKTADATLTVRDFGEYFSFHTVTDKAETYFHLSFLKAQELMQAMSETINEREENDES